MLLLLTACQHMDAPDSPVEEEAEANSLRLSLDGVRNILVLHVDAFRYDHMSLYGYERQTTPDLDGWWKMDGLVSAASWTAPSTASFLSGLDPQRHGIRYATPAESGLNANLTAPTFTEGLRDLGFQTFLSSGNNWVAPVTGIGNGFDTYQPVMKQYPEGNLDAQSISFDRFLQDRNPDLPFFAMMQVMDTHAGYFPIAEVAGTWAENVPFDVSMPSPDQDRDIERLYAEDTPGLVQAVNDVYDEQILGLDHSVWRLQRLLDARGLTDDTLVVFTADHGEKLGENGGFGHNGDVTSELVHLPLALYYPGLKPESPQCLSENVDTFPTLLTALGLPVPENIDGHPLQNGCRTYARSSVYGPNGDGYRLSVEDRENRLIWDCGSNRMILQQKDGERPPPATAKALYDEMRAFYDDITRNVPGQDCNFPEWSSVN